MRGKSISILTGTLVFVSVGGFVYLQSGSGNAGSQSPTVAERAATSSTTGTSTTTAIPRYSITEVAQHMTIASCWSVIDAHVYDLTEWISQHPGGERGILSLCGVDGTAAFHGRHGDEKKQADILATFKIGEFSK